MQNSELEVSEVHFDDFLKMQFKSGYIMRIRGKIAYFYKIIGNRIETKSSCRVFNSDDEYTQCTKGLMNLYKIEEKNIVFEYTFKEMVENFKTNFSLFLHEKQVENKFSALF